MNLRLRTLISKIFQHKLCRNIHFQKQEMLTLLEHMRYTPCFWWAVSLMFLLFCVVFIFLCLFVCLFFFICFVSSFYLIIVCLSLSCVLCAQCPVSCVPNVLCLVCPMLPHTLDCSFVIFLAATYKTQMTQKQNRNCATI